MRLNDKDARKLKLEISNAKSVTQMSERLGAINKTTDSASQSLLQVRDLKTYFFQDEGVVRAVDGATFDLRAGRTLAIVGESGCGKSVTTKSILRIVDRPGRIVGGEILLRRKSDETVDLTKLDSDGGEMRRVRGEDIGLIFQEPMTSFSPVHTVGNQLGEALMLHRRMSKREARERAIETLKLVGVPRPEGRFEEYPFQLSGGLRQRAMIAMALMCDPRILIADEPTTALDVTTQRQILDLLRGLQTTRDLALMLITHDMGVVAQMADEVAVMYLGRVVERGLVDDIFYQPKHPYTQALLRSIPSITAAPRTRLPTIQGTVPHPHNRPAGCPFHPRCPAFMPGTCDEHEPELHPAHGAQPVSCFLHHNVKRTTEKVAAG